MQGSDRSEGAVLRLAKYSFLLLLFSLAWMKAPLSIHGLDAFPADLLFIVTAALWLLALVAGQAELRWHRAFWLLGLYFAAMAASALVSEEPRRSAFKLLTQVYLLSLPVLAFNLVAATRDLRRVMGWWVAGSALVALIGAATLLLFPLLGPDSVLAWPLHHFGTLPAGPYPRLELTFLYPSMLASYLGVSLMLLLIGERLGWVGRRTAMILCVALLASALFALTPGFGGILFMLGAWVWYVARDERPRLARAALVVGCGMPLLAVLIAAISPAIYATAPFMIDVPGLSLTVAPSVRLWAWIDAVHNFLASPLLGRGIGVDAVTVPYEVRDCSEGCITDAHNTYLNIAAQTGIVGLAALLAIIWFVAGRAWEARARSEPNPIVFGLSIAWIAAFALQGLVGSFEDARHLWIVFGLILSAEAAARRGTSAT